LQYLLTHSFSGKALAIRRVTENVPVHGSNLLYRDFVILVA
jgi:hypothetical protein